MSGVGQWGRRAGHPNKRGRNGPPKRGSNSAIISIDLNHSEENWLADEKKPFRQTIQELIIIDFPLKRRSEWFKCSLFKLAVCVFFFFSRSEILFSHVVWGNEKNVSLSVIQGDKNINLHKIRMVSM